ncbi:MAG: ASCH domain-containing protein [Pseudomonadota bacterium]
MIHRTPEIEEFWGRYRRAAKLDHDHYTVVQMGDSPGMANELVDLMLAGPKRATASLAREYGDEEPLPKVGDHVVVVDAKEIPRCIWQTTEVTVKPLIEVDDAFAWDEGEGFRTRAYWLEAHRSFFAKEAAREGFEMHDGIETVFERFTLVWPPGAADPV